MRGLNMTREDTIVDKHFDCFGFVYFYLKRWCCFYCHNFGYRFLKVSLIDVTDKIVGFYTTL